MGLEAKVFERKRPDFEKLAEFGFHKDKEGYHYSQLFMDGDFRADISISLEGNVFGRVSIRRRERSTCPSMCRIRRGRL